MLLAGELTAEVAAQRIGISVNTFNDRLKELHRKFDCSTTRRLLDLIREEGLLNESPDVPAPLLGDETSEG